MLTVICRRQNSLRQWRETCKMREKENVLLKIELVQLRQCQTMKTLYAHNAGTDLAELFKVGKIKHTKER